MNAQQKSLLNKLKRLYTELFLVGLHKRIDSYHAFMHSDQHNDIGDTLHGLIDQIVIEASHNYSVQDYRHKKFLTAETDPTNDKAIPRQGDGSMLSMTLNGLSVFLQQQKLKSDNPHMAEKFQQVIWEHVHAAHRFARQGDARTAKLHADIANNAIKSLAHYMPVEAYEVLCNDIRQQLQPGAGDQQG